MTALPRIEPDPGHPTGQALCAKGRAARELVCHTQRLTRPLRRTRPKTEPSASSPPAAITRHPPARKGSQSTPRWRERESNSRSLLARTLTHFLTEPAEKTRY